jgi:Ni2+-binding GTPase involved in maturation of urease and hydrogenase
MMREEVIAMGKFAVFSGFLGSGKTTAMMALTRYYTERCGRAAMISNDMGRGVTLADHRLAKLSGVNAAEITEDCICYRKEDLAKRLNAFYAEGCDLVLSDIPGFGVGALEHVYHGLEKLYPGRFQLAPFTVLAEPRTLEALRAGTEEDLLYLCRAQLLEADLILLNKCDLLSPREREEGLAWLRENYPAAQVLPLSARTGEGLEALALAMKNGRASMRRAKIDCKAPAYRSAMGSLSEYYLQYVGTVCCNDFDGDAYLLTLAERVRERVRAAGGEIPHMKFLAWEPEGDFGKVDLLGTDRPIEVTRRFTRPCVSLAVVLNASAACPKKELDTLVTETVERVSEAFQLDLMIHRRDCFGMGA